MDISSGSTRLAPGLALLVLAGCDHSGQTGSPTADERPRYETPSRFSPDEPGSGGTDGEGPLFDTGNRPTYFPKGSELMALLPSGLAVTAVSRRGVLVYEVADPSKPRVVGELPMPGSTVHQLLLDGDDAAPAITLLVTEGIAVDEPRVPEEPIASSAVRLVHVDLSDPTAPVRAAQVDLEGDPWQFARRGDRYYLLSELYQPVEPVCGPQTDIAKGGPRTRAMRVSDYELAAAGFVRGDTIELPADAPYAFAAGDAYFVPNHYYDSAEGQSTLGSVSFASGSLAERAAIPLDGKVLAVAEAGDAPAVLIERGGEQTLELFAFDASGTASERGELAVGRGKVTLELLPGVQRALIGGASGAEGAQALLVDIADPAHPALVQQFPADTLRLVPVPQGVLGLGPSSTGHLVASLWALPDSDAPQPLGRVATPWPWANSDPGYEPYRVDAEHGLLLAPVVVGNDEYLPAVGAARFDDAGVSVYGEYALREAAFRPITDGVNLYSAGYEGLDVVPLVQGATAESPSGGYAPFYEPEPIAQLSSSGREIRLHERPSDGRFVVEVAPASGDGEPTTLELDHRGDGLVAAEDRVVVVGVRWDSECQYMEPSADPAAAFDRCADYRGRGITVLDVRGEPRVVASFELPNDLDFDPIDGVTPETEWSGYVELPDGRIAFPVQRWLRCESHESCKALGVPAYEGMATPGCNPQTQNCDELPAVETFVSGARSSLLLYVLQDAGGEPALQLGAEIEGRFQLPGEGPLDVGWQLLRNDGGIAFAREEPIYNAEGNSVNNAHGDAIVQFFLDRIAIEDDGALRALPSVNTPGRPVAWLGDFVYTVEPAYDDEGEVFVNAHRARLRDDAAHVDATIELGDRFLDARAVGDRLMVLRGLGDPCSENPRTALFSVALGPDALDKSGALELPGHGWGFPFGPAADAEGHVLVHGGPLGYPGHLEVDADGDGAPSVVRYRSEPSR